MNERIKKWVKLFSILVVIMIILRVIVNLGLVEYTICLIIILSAFITLGVLCIFFKNTIREFIVYDILQMKIRQIRWFRDKMYLADFTKSKEYLELMEENLSQMEQVYKSEILENSNRKKQIDAIMEEARKIVKG